MPRREDILLQERVEFSFAQASATDTDETHKLYQVPAGRKLRIDRVTYVNPTGLTEDASDFVDIILQKNDGVSPVTVANWSTETGQEGTITADTFIELVLAADGPARVADAGDDIELQLDFTVSGTQTLPDGRLVVEGRLL